MKKKIIIFILLFFLLFVAINYKNIISDYYANIGNNLYEEGKNQEKIADKKEYWLSSISSYENALDYRQHELTQDNLDFVKKKLAELDNLGSEDSKQNKDEQEQKDKGNKGNTAESHNEQKSESGSGTKNKNENNKNKDGKLGEGNNQGNSGSIDDNKLTNGQKADLKKYINFLKSEQLKNSGNFNKQKKENNNYDSFFEIFGNKANLLYDINRGEEKDW